MKKAEVVATILGLRQTRTAHQARGQAFAPTNIALCKYWGKRDAELNLPVTSSLSISLGNKGAQCAIERIDQDSDIFSLNGQMIASHTSFAQRLAAYLNLFRTPDNFYFQVTMQMNIPVAAGLASSACGFAALALALNDFFTWQLNKKELSILARLGSGSACRSVFSGFVEWHAGFTDDGMDSYSELLPDNWPAFCIGLLMIHPGEKPLSSRLAMERTAATSPLYSAWPKKVRDDLATLKQALVHKDFKLLGETAESNALAMHALMLSAWPPISYTLPETLTQMQKIWELRQNGLPLYFTQDAGPNLKLLFLKQDQAHIEKHFPKIEILQPQLS